MIWLIGAKGMLGTHVARLLTEKDLFWTGSGSEVDISNPAAVENFITSTETNYYLSSHKNSQIRKNGKSTGLLTAPHIRQLTMRKTMRKKPVQ